MVGDYPTFLQVGALVWEFHTGKSGQSTRNFTISVSDQPCGSFHGARTRCLRKTISVEFSVNNDLDQFAPKQGMLKISASAEFNI